MGWIGGIQSNTTIKNHLKGDEGNGKYRYDAIGGDDDAADMNRKIIRQNVSEL